jgi:hypothetical protein
MPNVVRSAGRGLAEVYPERKVWGDGPEWGSRLLKRTIQKTELQILPDEPKIGVWGRKAPRVGLGPASDLVWQMVVPVKRREEDIVVGDRVILNWNAQNPNDEKHPIPPRPVYTVDKKQRQMTEEQYTQFLTLSGKAASHLMEAMADSIDVDKPSEVQMGMVTQVLSNARREAKKQLIVEWGGGRKAQSAEVIGRRKIQTVRKWLAKNRGFKKR